MDGRLATAASESEFGNLGIDLAASLAIGIEDLIRASTSRRERNDGILRGLAVRTVKLLDRLVDEITQDHGELEGIYQRMLDDTLVTLAYLLAAGPNGFDSYLAESAIAQKRRKKTIEAHIAERGGVADPIETRMLRAIGEQMSLAGLDPDAPPKRLPPMDQRIAAVLPAGSLTYDFGYRVGSDWIHGGWHDLISHHVDPHSDFAPRLEWWPADPDQLFVSVYVGAEFMSRYAASMAVDEVSESLASIRDFAGRATEAYGSYIDEVRGPELPRD